MQSGLKKFDKWIIEFITEYPGKNPLMGWESSTDTFSELNLEFKTKDNRENKDDILNYISSESDSIIFKYFFYRAIQQQTLYFKPYFKKYIFKHLILWIDIVRTK